MHLLGGKCECSEGGGMGKDGQRGVATGLLDWVKLGGGMIHVVLWLKFWCDGQELL